MRYDTVKREELACSYDTKLGVMVHRFKIVATICQCGSVSVQKGQTHGGWRQLHDDTPKIKG